VVLIVESCNEARYFALERMVVASSPISFGLANISKARDGYHGTADVWTLVLDLVTSKMSEYFRSGKLVALSGDGVDRILMEVPQYHLGFFGKQVRDRVVR